MTSRILIYTLAIASLGFGIACNKDATSYKAPVKAALEQADLKDVTVSEDSDKNTITLGGTLHTEEAKQRAMDIAKAAAGTRIVANEVSVQPMGMESEAKSIDSNLDTAIEHNYKAALIAKGLSKQDVSYSAKNGVLMLTGSVKTTAQRQEAEQVALAVPNVKQVVNQLEVK